MSTQVRTFTPPQPLGQTLSQPTPRADTPRSIPEQPVFNNNNITKVPASPSKKDADYKRVPMDSHHDKKQPGGITFAAQDKLPKLPIPDLEQTVKRYLDALRPLQSSREHGDTEQAVDEFLRNDGPELQEKLKNYAQSKTSYIEQFWYDSYLNFDNPVVLNLNPFFLLEDDPTPARNNQITRAASLVVSALEFVRAVRKEELPPDTVKGTPLCMYQFSRLFGTARVPTEAGCQIEQDPNSKHMVVMCHGQLYWFDVLDDNSDVIMSERDIALNLQTVLDDAQQIPIREAAKGALGVLSTENRKVWSGLRDVLTREPGSNNADSLNIVDSALFILCLDYTEPPNVAALCQNMLCGTSQVEKGVQIGTCTNRWYDKLQIIVCKNGSAGINFEHTGVDGHTVLRFASDVYTDTILRFARTINGQAPTLWTSTSPDPSKRDPASFGDVNTTPRKLEWDMIPELNIAVRFAETRLADLIEQNEFQCLDFSSYGKNFITSMGFSPDAFVQMAFQAAYYGLYGRVECTYEPAMTKVFLHGRTEAIRPVTDESVNFVQSFWADNPAEQKVEALRKACQKHVDATRVCAKAQGCDRHLYALFCVWQKHVNEEMQSSRSSDGYSSPLEGYSDAAMSPVGSPPKTTGESMDGVEVKPTRERGGSTGSRNRDHIHPLPLLFADCGWDRLNTTVLSTSNCGNPSLRHFGFGPTSGDGFGIGYIIKDESISICISSKHRQTRRFVDTLESYLLEIRRILRITNRKASVAGAQKGSTRAREAEEAHKKPVVHKSSSETASRLKSRGRLITQDSLRSIRQAPSGTMSPTEESVTVSEEDDELGGYGFFDAGMLLQALKARGDKFDGSETKASERAAVQARRRDVGKKLRLSEY
ncbi:Choline/Carnitine o-acyltransferase-domain-containing protein [Emericellopsis atlantica]|uniref:Choline/Carnitine o-acyltransferase-domain-containing protein n=1 Tax=Emericellopsis atlantica TaxID=2614577 RepID=A0A9P8CSJ5_9HYPO|nr:Choline/Carnitine o-acyltransferase-domain-containing protein [Emericellopsis atlantica]KAG9257412.1 Choline/Carnitine o-acyltransferase-domain-containing protein [Emericellopsis atlantica]